MTGQEIADSTPWEITKRIDGYLDRMKDRRIFTASFITAPVINSGMRCPKHGVTVKDLLPNDCKNDSDHSEMERIKKLIEEQEEKRRKQRGTHDTDSNHG